MKTVAGEKKSAKLAPSHPSGPLSGTSGPHFFQVWAPTLRGPTLWAPTLCGPKIQCPKIGRSRNWPKSHWPNLKKKKAGQSRPRSIRLAFRKQPPQRDHLLASWIRTAFIECSVGWRTSSTTSQRSSNLHNGLWQHKAASRVERAHRETQTQIFSRMTDPAKALVRSHGGSGGGLALLTCPTCRPKSIRTCFKSFSCVCKWPSTCIFCHHRAACARARVLGTRGYALESAAARMCREAGGRVTTNVLVREQEVGRKRPILI